MATSDPKPAPPGLRERKKARLRRKIMDTTVALCRERGYENTTLEEIVRIVEISQPTFYNYFASKDAVLREFARELLASGDAALADGDPREEGAADRLRRHYRGVGEWMELDQPLWRSVVPADGFNRAKTSERREAPPPSGRMLERIIAEGQATGEFTKEFSPESLARNLEAIQGLACLQWGEQPEPTFSLQARLAEGIEFFLRAARA